MNYYNDNDPHAVAWLKALMAEGLISAGDIDDRPIQEVRVEDLRGYTRIHLFAGIGGWERALNLAGWGDSPILTASLPCQPFSAAGKQKSIRDDRHLWPIVRELIEGLNPPFVIGEQVASAEVVGTQQETAFLESVQSGDYARANKLAKRLAQSKSFHYWPRWVDGIQADLEKAGYAFRFVVLGAHSLGAPHIRQRLWWMADTESQHDGAGESRPAGRGKLTDSSACSGLADHHGERCNGESVCLQPRKARQDDPEITGRSDDSRLADTSSNGSATRVSGQETGHERDSEEPDHGCDRFHFWADSIWWPCRDGKYRRVPARWVEPAGKWEIESSLFPLDDGLPGRVGLLRGAGNAVVPQVAAAFIKMNITIMKRDKENEME